MKCFPSLSNAGRPTALVIGGLVCLASCEGPGFEDVPPDPARLESEAHPIVVATLEAEKAILSGAVLASNQAGFTGTGFADYQNASGDYVEWSADLASAGRHTLTIRYANGSTSSRPLVIAINGTVAQASLGFPGTGAWTTWKTVVFAADLAAGRNRIRASASGSSGANLDNLVISSTSTGGGGADGSAGAGGTSGTGGSTGMGGSTGTGGSTGMGGSTGTGGGTGMGGSTGTGGGTGMGGSTGTGGTTGGPPTAADLLALTRSCTQISSGKYATDEGGSAQIPVCKLNGAVFWKADMDIDCDGKQTATCNSSTDPWYQSQTSFGSNIDAAALPYVVIPLPSSKFDYRKQGIAGGQSVAVIYNGKLVYGVFVDEGPSGIIGEASVAMANALGIPSNPKTGGVDSGVTYIVFTGSSGVVAPLTSTSSATSVGQARAADVLKQN